MTAPVPDPRLLSGMHRPAGDQPGPSVAAGESSVDAATAELAKAAALPPAEQIEVYESVHQALQETLQTIEQA